MRYYWSFNKDDELWHNYADTIEGCIEEAKREDKDIEDGCVWIAELDCYQPSIDVDVNVIGMLQNKAWEECGEGSDGWLDGVDATDLDKQVIELILNWLKETNNLPTFGGFKWIKKYDLETGKEIN